MLANIKNYRGLASASLDLTKICLVAGANEAGKTSTAQAVAAALTGDPVPIPGVKKSSAGLLVRSGTASGSIDLTTDAGSTNIVWPGAKVKTEGTAPFASHYAVGLASIATLPEKDRPAVLAEYLKSAPVRGDLDAQLSSMGLPVAVLDQLWALIETQGWDNAHSQIKEKGARLKGQWQEVTGEQYGSKKAESWLPDGWEQELMGQSEATLKALTTDARDALEATIATVAVDGNRHEELRALVALLPGRKIDALAAENATVDPAMKHQLTECEGFISGMAEKRDVLKQNLKNLPTAEQAAGQPCPECGTVLTVTGGVLLLAAQTPQADLDLRQTAINALTEQIAGVNDAISTHMAQAAQLKQQISRVAADKTALAIEAKRLVTESQQAEAEMNKAPAGTTGNGGDTETFRNALALAESRLKAFVGKNNADRLHTSISQNAELIAKIAPEGIRGDVLAKALKGFNERTAPICKASGWPTVGLDNDFAAEYGGTPYLLLSESAKFRVRTVLALVMAQMDGSEAVIVDAADILDKTGRNGLFKALKLVALPALVCMTMDARELVPKLGALGVSYWIEGGEVSAV